MKAILFRVLGVTVLERGRCSYHVSIQITFGNEARVEDWSSNWADRYQHHVEMWVRSFRQSQC